MKGARKKSTGTGLRAGAPTGLGLSRTLGFGAEMVTVPRSGAASSTVCESGPVSGAGSPFVFSPKSAGSSGWSPMGEGTSNASGAAKRAASESTPPRPRPPPRPGAVRRAAPGRFAFTVTSPSGGSRNGWFSKGVSGLRGRSRSSWSGEGGTGGAGGGGGGTGGATGGGTSGGAGAG